MSDLLQVQGINAKGFGVIPKIVMQDRRLTTEAKSIYAYFCSYAGEGRTAFPGREKIIADLGMSLKRYYRHFQLLVLHGYIRAEQENKNGRFQRNVYTLLSNVPCSQNGHTEALPCSQNAYTQNDYTKINSLENIYLGNANSQVLSVSEEAGQDGTDTITEQDIQRQLAEIRDQIDYAALVEANPEDAMLIDEIVSVILDVMVTPGKFVRIDREDRPRALVRHQFGLLDYERIELVISQFKSVTERVTRKRQYLLTALYNVRMEFDAHYTNLVQHNMAAG